MSISKSLLPEFDQEMDGTRKVLERVPLSKADWKPHPKSGSMLWLAQHVANLPSWAQLTMQTESLDLGQKWDQPKPPTTTEELVAIFDKNRNDGRAALANATDEQFGVMWTLRNGDHKIFTIPRLAVVRGVILNHIIHHRGQLTVYLRLNDVPVPGLYGPSADEGNF